VEKGHDGVWRYELRDGGALDPETLYRVAGFAPMQPGVWIKKMTAAQRAHSAGVWPVVDVLDLPDYAFPRAIETLFESEAQLEAALERAITDRAWREQTVRMQREATLTRHTYDSLARDVVTMVGGAIVEAGEVAA
jgi:hypothetical protein